MSGDQFSSSEIESEELPTEQLDLVYMYSSPLVFQDNDWNFKDCLDSLDFDKEIKPMEFYLKMSNKQFKMKIEAASREKLHTYLLEQPKILHISSHGSFKSKINQYYLQFEAEETGLKEDLTENTLRNLLRRTKFDNIKVVFVSACYSQKIGQIFADAGIPVVVSVNSDCQIYDVASNQFSRKFYESLLRNMTVEEAFNEGRKSVENQEKFMYSCCCHHQHEPNCKWQILREKDEQLAHDIHKLRQCKLKCQDHEKNWHHTNCQTYQAFIKELSIDMVPLLYNQKSAPLCCCKYSDEFHLEANKFILTATEEGKKLKLFKHNQSGSLKIISDVDKNTNIQAGFDQIQLYGRKFQAKQIIDQLQKCRIVGIYGEQDMGKTDIAKFVGRYMLVRRLFQNGAYHIDLSQCVRFEQIMSEISKTTNNQSTESEEALFQTLKYTNILLVIDHCDQFMNSSADSIQFKKFLKKIVDSTLHVKVLLLSQSSLYSTFVKFKKWNEVKITGLSKFQLVGLLSNILVNGQGVKFNSYEKTKTLKHSLFNEISDRPIDIKQCSYLFKGTRGKVYDIIKVLDEISASLNEQRKSNRESADKTFGSQSMRFRELKTRFSGEKLRLLTLIGTFQNGILKKDLYSIIQRNLNQFGDSFYLFDTEEQLEDGEPKLAKQEMQNLLQNSQGELVCLGSYDGEILQSQLNENDKFVIFECLLDYFATLSYSLQILIRKKRKCVWINEGFSLIMGESDFWHDSSLVDLRDFMFNAEHFIGEQIFNRYEGTFNLIINKFKDYSKEIKKEKLSSQFSEMTLNIIQILLLMKKFNMAEQLIQQCLEIATKESMKLTRAKYLILRSIVYLKLKDPNELFKKSLLEAHTTLKFLIPKVKRGTSYLSLGIGEVLYISCVYMVKDYAVNSFKQVPTEILNIEKQKTSNAMKKNQSFYSLKEHFSQDQIEANCSKLENIKNQLKKTKLNFKENIRKDAFGGAKVVLLECEFIVSTQQTNEIQENESFCKSYSDKNVHDLIETLKSYAEQFPRQDQLQMQSRILLSELYLFQEDYDEAQVSANQAIKLTENEKFSDWKTKAKQMLGKIRERQLTSIPQSLDFTFLEANPVINEFSSSIQFSYPITRFHSLIEEKVIRKLEKTKKGFCYKIDSFDEKNFAKLKSIKTKVLFISSTVYDQKDTLYIENQYCDVVQINYRDLEQRLTQTYNFEATVLIIAIPQTEARNLEQAFLSAGCQNVISFSMHQKVLEARQNDCYIDQLLNDFYLAFTTTFLQKLMNNNYSIFNAFKEASSKTYVAFKGMFSQALKASYEIKNKILIKQLNKDDSLSGLFTNGQEIINKTKQKGLYQSEIEHLHGISMTGRQTELLQALQTLLSYKCDSERSERRCQAAIMNVYGPAGIGKSIFISEIGLILRDRIYQRDEIEARTYSGLESLKKIKYEDECGQVVGLPQKKHVYLLIDDLKLDTKQDSEVNDFMKWISEITSHKNIQMNIVFTTRQRLQNKMFRNRALPIHYVRLQELTKIEHADQQQSINEHRQLHNHHFESLRNQKLEEQVRQQCMNMQNPIQILASNLSGTLILKQESSHTKSKKRGWGQELQIILEQRRERFPSEIYPELHDPSQSIDLPSLQAQSSAQIQQMNPEGEISDNQYFMMEDEDLVRPGKYGYFGKVSQVEQLRQDRRLQYRKNKKDYKKKRTLSRQKKDSFKQL